ncbi:MAG: 5-oxoprolinase [Saprospiraceae bacterium]|nr:MAG: 5-oxoprolinase [Saprospiraceae bacterium]
MGKPTNNWQIWIDTGGTFTDCIALSPGGERLRAKVLSSGRLRGRIKEKISKTCYRFSHKWHISRDIFTGYRWLALEHSQWETTIEKIDIQEGLLFLKKDLPLPEGLDFEITADEEAPILAARLVTQTSLKESLPSIDMRLGSTKGTNALLERKGAEVTLLITKGFKDLLLIGTQQRPHLFQLDIPEPQPLYAQVIEVEERLDAKGKVITPLKQIEIKDTIGAIETEVVAVSLMHAYRNPVHERMLEAALRAEGFQYISLSQQLSPGIKLLPRTQTTLVNAYLSPVLTNYLDNISLALANANLLIMTSAGGLAPASTFFPKDSLLSGPAGGVVGAARIARQLGLEKVLTLDMGGTSTDTARYDGTFDYQFTTHIEAIEMRSPSLAIETVAAGGGSICGFDGHKLTVGPESAGASPGPACYGAGGPLTITDVNLLLGKLEVSEMGIPINLAKARAALLDIQQQILLATKEHYPELELLQGFEQIANEKMAEAIRRISVAKGFDPREYTLLAFGGAGGLHVCRVAELLDIDTAILAFDGGLLCAYGIGHARVERMAEQQILKPLTAVESNLKSLVDELSQKAQTELKKEGYSIEKTEITQCLVYLRFVGQENSLELDFFKTNGLASQFALDYQELFGHYPQRSLEVESIKVIAATLPPEISTGGIPKKTFVPKADKTLAVPISGHQVDVYTWPHLDPGAVINGPAILVNPTSTAYLEAGWQLIITAGRNAMLQLVGKVRKQNKHLKEAVALELFTNRFKAIAEEMGAQLQRTAFSINVKERLDFSCAILDANAELLVNAPHIPVHLGSLGICARLVLQKLPLSEGDVIIVNHPKYGGSHLPDITLLAAVYSKQKELIGYVINRAHHAEIGGKRPGSMPPDARNLEEEGVVFLPTYLAKAGEIQWSLIEGMLINASYPTRALAENIADISAALASLRSGAKALEKLAQNHGLQQVKHYMQALKEQSAEALAKALRLQTEAHFFAQQKLDDGHLIQVRARLKGGRLNLDFAGTSGVHPRNLNANISIVYSAVIYVLRLLCKKDIPLNEGLMQNVDINLPISFLHPDFSDDAKFCPAVVGGNTEVSQRLVDTLLKAFSLAACSQGTMNNFLFGNEHFGYYETIGGGAGAGPGFHGRSGVHQHMTNTRITDPEELEFRYPVRLIRFALRPGSGGAGRYRGGDGIIREIEFLSPMEITILSQHRQEAPYGMAGGEPGKCGAQYLIHLNGSHSTLEGLDSRSLQAGERILIETPGGGGWSFCDKESR